MRLKTFTAPTMAEAMDRVREELGDDAIIVSSQAGGEAGDCSVTAALEPPDPAGNETEATPQPDPGADANADAGGDDGETALLVRQTLVRHGTPPRLVARLARAVAAEAAADAVAAFAVALAAAFRFSPLPGPGTRARLMLVGPPGAGKTISAAKLAAIWIAEAPRDKIADRFLDGRSTPG